MELSINDVISSLPPFLTPLTDSNGIIHDNSSVALRCNSGHIHKYFILDIINNMHGNTSNDGSTNDNGGRKRSDINCITCSIRGAFPNLVRRVAENIFGAPFVIIAGTETFNCPTKNITLVCVKTSGKDWYDEAEKTAYIHYTTSAKKIEIILRTISGSSNGSYGTSNIKPKFRKDPIPLGIDSPLLCIENCTTMQRHIIE